MEIDIFCCTPDEVVFSQIRENSAACKRWAKTVPAHEGHAVIVGGGPSLRGRISAVRSRQDHGQTVFALNGAGLFLNQHGITPEYQVLLDPQPSIRDYIAEAREYLVASQCHPDIPRALTDPILWHFAAEGAEAHVPEHNDDFCLIGGGITVGLSSMCLAYALGYRNLHLYGFDSSVADDGDHAYRHPALGVAFETPAIVRAKIGGKTFYTTFSLAKQAQEFSPLCNQLIARGCTITVDCDGLIKAVADEINSEAARAA